MHSKLYTIWMLCNAHDDMSNFSIRSKNQRCYIHHQVLSLPDPTQPWRGTTKLQFDAFPATVPIRPRPTVDEGSPPSIPPELIHLHHELRLASLSSLCAPVELLPPPHHRWRDRATMVYHHTALPHVATPPPPSSPQLSPRLGPR
jgi:hypothetical protein